MQITKKILPKSQVELLIEIPYEELKPYLLSEAEKITLAGFRPGKTPYEIVKQQIGETKLLNNALPKIFQDTLIETFLKENLKVIGEPVVDIEKLEHGSSLTYKATASLLPNVKLGDYKKIIAKKKEIEIKESEIEKTLCELRDHKAKEVITARAAKNGDVVNIDFNMLFDKIPLEGGQFKNYRIIAGKEIFPKTFNENIAGMKGGEEKEFDVMYPTEHFDKKLAGKNITFKLKMNQVYERILPDLNDEFANSFGNFDTLKDLKEHIKQIIKNDKERNEKERFEEELLDKLLNLCEFDEIPDILLDSETNKMLGELEANISSQGGKFEDYLSHIKKSKEDIKKDFTEQAVKRVKIALAIKQIAQIEDIQVEEKEVEDEISSYKSYWANMSYPIPQEIEKKIKSAEYKNYLKNILANKKVIEKLAEWAQAYGHRAQNKLSII
ncbi:MAG: trigger factor [bacterium]